MTATARALLPALDAAPWPTWASGCAAAAVTGAAASR